ncbi:hypothetical protein GO495_31700 [Chitinophaga oryziterrae]|uniref:Uncharacterized protein n=1 Tax=Chitinophaga oryziterrae TaxID=1031224 RepID=A0A6N8JLD8_9BACT|nr:hypothetical protein [Chitinophaga oryziterrae]MVT45196.1 hypothetical protein [Chitinophaga oryziterrae]
MAKLIGSPPFVGTQDGLTIYQLEGEQYYVRIQSSITGKRIKKDKAFAGFRDSSSRLRIASRIASAVYRQFIVKEYPLYREMTGKAILWLKEGSSIPVVEARLRQAYKSKCAVNEAESRRSYASEVKQPCRKVVVKGLFHIPGVCKTGVNGTRRRRGVHDKANYANMYLFIINFVNASHQHTYP